MSARSVQRDRAPEPIPARAGIGLRACHHARLLNESRPIGWLEAHTENYFAAGGALPRVLERLRAAYPLSLHGVGLGLGNVDPIDRDHFAAVRRLVRRYEPAFVSEHLSWSAIGGRSTNDLLPMPYTEEALRHLVARIRMVQELLDREILVENVSTYFRYESSELEEWDFLAAVAREAGCGILLDLNNVYVNAMNHDFDAAGYLRAIPVAAVREFHLAGHRCEVYGARELRIDTHSTPVCEAVWQLFALALERFGARPTLIEWDSEIPALEVLEAEAARADALIEQCHAVAA
jgi:uncharacterized protein (UPF0276 family)